MTQIITNSNWGWGSSSSWDMKKSVYDPQNIESDAFDYNNFTNTPDLSDYQTTANLVTDLSNPDNTHYPSAKAVSDAISWAWAGDMLKSVYDPNSVEANAFDYNNFINTPDIPTDTSELTNWAWFITGIDSWDVTTALWYTPYNATNPNGYVTDSIINDTAYGSWWDGDTTHAPTKNAVYDKIDSIDELIPSAATSSNQLADKNYVNDSINSVTAYYITKNAQWDQFATKAELTAATTFYSWWVARTPTRNDYTIVLADEDHDNATTRYIYNSGWEYQYTVNETALTQEQLYALNSWITCAKVSAYDCYATSKQDTLCSQTNYTAKGNCTCVAQITTNCLGQVTCIDEVAIDFPVTSVNGCCWDVCINAVQSSNWTYEDMIHLSQSDYDNLGTYDPDTLYSTPEWDMEWVVDDTAFWASWDWDTTHAPSKNAIYDVLGDVETLLANI